MKRKVVVSNGVLKRLKQLKTPQLKTYNDIITWLLDHRLELAITNRLDEVKVDNNYKDINETIENMIVELEKFIGED